MTKQLWDMVNDYRAEGYMIADEEAIAVHRLCVAKMNVGNVENQQEYLPLLYADELKNHLVRRMVNGITYCRMILKEDEVCVLSAER